ncbi:MAG: hypothetical protein B6D59_00910 [Campylobacteraceae bacterium 4484_4]|nr:MAG: hypothetical protein B6D59_00910 [Campylobacteraceae bacterium 4484_4]
MTVLDMLKDFFRKENYPFVLLFGSWSNGTQTDQSDVDIGLFFEKEVDYKDLGYQSAMLEKRVGKKIDMIALNDIYKKDPFFAFEILKSHTPVLLNDEEAYLRFKTSCQLYYLDAKPLIKMNEKAFAERIENDRIGERNFAATT